LIFPVFFSFSFSIWTCPDFSCSFLSDNDLWDTSYSESSFEDLIYVASAWASITDFGESSSLDADRELSLDAFSELSFEMGLLSKERSNRGDLSPGCFVPLPVVFSVSSMNSSSVFF